MKVGAHPMVVAVALGLLSPTALAVEAEDERAIQGCADCDGSCVTMCDEEAPPAQSVASEDPLAVMVRDVWADMAPLTMQDPEVDPVA